MSRPARLALVILALVASTSRATADDLNYADCGKFFPVAGTTRYSTAIQLRRSNAQIYGAARFLEREILPALEDNWAMAAVQMNGIWLVNPVPSAANPAPKCSFRFGMNPMHLYAGASGFGFGNEWVKFFYASGLTANLPQDKGFTAGLAPYTRMATGAFIGLAAPAIVARQKEDLDAPGSTAIDYITGLKLDAGGLLSAAAGYVGSTGVFGNVTVPKIELYGTFAVAADFDVLAYFSSGIGPHRVLGGTVSGYARKVDFTSVPRVDPGNGHLIDEPVRHLPFWTAHAEANGLFRLLDLQIVYAVKPKPLLHAVTIGVGHDDERTGVRYSVAGGHVRMPELYFLGLTDQSNIYFRAEVSFTAKFGTFGYRLQYNDPEILALMPAAQDGVHHFIYGQYYTDKPPRRYRRAD